MLKSKTIPVDTSCAFVWSSLFLFVLCSGCSDPAEVMPEEMQQGDDQGVSSEDMSARMDMPGVVVPDAGADMPGVMPDMSVGEDAGVDMREEEMGSPPAPGCELAPPPQGTMYYVATDGDDGAGDGSADAPWATITHALDNAEDPSTILVRPGTYNGRIRMRGSFTQGVTVRSEVPYQARLRHDGPVLTFYKHPAGCEGITLEGFDVAHSDAGASALVVHLDGGGDNSVSRITLRDNILHDSYDNDILKINNSTTQIVVERNMFYNQTGSDEHIDINSVDDVIVQDNVFFNDFEGSGRTDGSDTSSFIVIKDSNGSQDLFTGSSNVHVQRNVFLNWQGSTGSGFLLIGEDGQPFFEGRDILVENNLFVGNSRSDMRSPFGVKGGRDIAFRHNTIVGDLPSRAYAMRLNTEGLNPPNENITFHNNIWSDPTGTMGQDASAGGGTDFSDTQPDQLASFMLSTNLYWNGGMPLPDTSDDVINPSDDASALEADPILPDASTAVVPRWVEATGSFAGGASSICEAHRGLVEAHATPGTSSPVLGAAQASESPDVDILRRPRGSSPDIGAVELP